MDSTYWSPGTITLIQYLQSTLQQQSTILHTCINATWTNASEVPDYILSQYMFVKLLRIDTSHIGPSAYISAKAL